MARSATTWRSSRRCSGIRRREFSREIKLDLPAAEPKHDVLATLWARTRVDDLMGQDYYGMQRGTVRDDIRKQITDLGLEYRLMTQFTSFVAVEEMTVTDGGKPRRVEVPVELPEGVSERAIQELSINGRNVNSLGMIVGGGVSVMSAGEVVTVAADAPT